jgi:hypothetical protein
MDRESRTAVTLTTFSDKKFRWTAMSEQARPPIPPRANRNRAPVGAA